MEIVKKKKRRMGMRRSGGHAGGAHVGRSEVQNEVLGESIFPGRVREKFADWQDLMKPLFIRRGK
jgi:hypothetical protein